MTRGGRHKTRQEPERACIVTRGQGPKGGLVRFVVGPDGTVVPDLAGKLPGRGLWVSADAQVLDKAIAAGAFSRAARQKLVVPDTLRDQVIAGLVQRLQSGISLSRKAGAAVAGYEKVRGWLISGEAIALIQASDGSPRERARLRPPAETGCLIDCLSAAELGLAFGREHVIHGALATGGLAQRVVEDAAKLAGLRKTDGGAAPAKGTKTR